MNERGLKEIGILFLAGMVGSVLVGLVAFRSTMFYPSHPFFQSISIGALMAALLGLFRCERRTQALVVAVVFVLVQFTTFMTYPLWKTAASIAWSVMLAAGIMLVVVIYDLLARLGYRLGKFLLMGPLLGGVYIAATPVTVIRGVTPDHAITTMILNAFLGIVIGDGVGLGAEIAELFIGRNREKSETA